jgi:hypothetical protein
MEISLKDNDFQKVKTFFESFGYVVLDKPDPQDNCCDMTVCGKKKALRVEIKKLRILENGSWQVPQITENQKIYDCVAVVLPTGAVFVEKMDDYLKSCSDEGFRTMTWLKL